MLFYFCTSFKFTLLFTQCQEAYHSEQETTKLYNFVNKNKKDIKQQKLITQVRKLISLILLCGGTKHTVVSSMENKNRKRECICKQFPVEKRQDFISIGLDYFSDGSHGIQLNGINIHPKPKPKVAFSAIPSTLPCITHISTNNLIKYLL